MNLYEIDHAILDCVDMETGEIVNVDALNALDIERDAKVENIALWIKNDLSNAEQIKSEIKALEERKNSAEKNAEKLKKYLSGYLNGSKFSTSKVAISFRKSESVDVLDINKIMSMNDANNYLRYKEPEPDKTSIKQAIKSGKNIPGCRLVEKQNIQIK